MLRTLVISFAALVGSLAAAGCSASDKEDALAGAGDDTSTDPGSAQPTSCLTDDDCTLGAATCCACPTFATSATEPSDLGCNGVACPNQPDCPDNVRAACNVMKRECVVACVEMSCQADCGADGYAIDPATGCLSCMCATRVPNGCTVNRDCVENRKDCCGCAQGGFDIAVLATAQPAYDQGLGCDGSEACPGIDVCDPAAAPTCVAGACSLTAATRPAHACSSRAECPTGNACVVNRNPDASALGVGVCVPP